MGNETKEILLVVQVKKADWDKAYTGPCQILSKDISLPFRKKI